MLTKNPTYRQQVNQKRCLVPADGFYEWRASPTGKRPYRILLKDESLFCFASLWDGWADPEPGEVLDTTTTEANTLMRPLYDAYPCSCTRKRRCCGSR